MPQSQADLPASDVLPVDPISLQTKSWSFGLPSLPKLPWSRKPLEDTISLPANAAEKLEADANPLVKRPSRDVVTGLPRTLTFKRQDSERRDRLLPFQLSNEQRRALASRRQVRAYSTSRLQPNPHELAKHRSEPDLRDPTVPLSLESYLSAGSSAHNESSLLTPSDSYQDLKDRPAGPNTTFAGLAPPVGPQDAHQESDPETASEDQPEDLEWQKDLDQKWILNLSMAFRDKSDREKFFLTYAEQPNRWRRLTISVDYRNAEDDSLESDLKSLHYQRDKSARIYESIHESLPSIRFFDTVTNLKLQTIDGRLHVHVTEDVNETIKYPPASSIRHLELRPQELVRETSLHFESHLSGFVYRVRHNGRTFIKKEIPAPEMVEEFLYEIAALDRLRDAPDVIDLEGVVVDDAQETIKGLLLSYASHGALIDYLYDHKHDSSLTWERQEKWARQIIGGVSAIHEHGFVQGDLTLSNIVIDAHDNAKVIDMNRRGCPMGWEPPEFQPIIQNGQRISMFIGVKSDLYQLGMVLWGLAMKIDEPEREEAPLNFDGCEYYIPPHYRTVVDLCLREKPEERVAATKLLQILTMQSHSSGYEYIAPSGVDEGLDGQSALDEAYQDRSSAVVTSSVTGTAAATEPSSSRIANLGPSRHDRSYASGGFGTMNFTDSHRGQDTSHQSVEEPDIRGGADAPVDQAEDVTLDLDRAANEVLGVSGHHHMAYADAAYADPVGAGFGLDALGHAGGQFQDPVSNVYAHEAMAGLGTLSAHGLSTPSRTPTMEQTLEAESARRDS